MSLNIKNPRVHDLARRAAAVTGKTQTGAIEEALERLLRDYDADPVKMDIAWRRDQILRLGEGWHEAEQHMHPEAIRSTDDLYDPVTGLPA